MSWALPKASPSPCRGGSNGVDRSKIKHKHNTKGRRTALFCGVRFKLKKKELCIRCHIHWVLRCFNISILLALSSNQSKQDPLCLYLHVLHPVLKVTLLSFRTTTVNHLSLTAGACQCATMPRSSVSGPYGDPLCLSHLFLSLLHFLSLLVLVICFFVLLSCINILFFFFPDLMHACFFFFLRTVSLCWFYVVCLICLSGSEIQPVTLGANY